MNKKYLSEMMRDVSLDENTLIVSPTGSGKTHYIFNELCKDKKVLYLCDNSNLEEQVSMEDNTKVVKEKKPKRGFNKTNVFVMTYKYFGAKIKFDLDDEYINSFDLIIADEVHNLVDYQSFDNDIDLSHALVALMKKYNDTQILMFTATPYYLDELARKNPGIDVNFTKVDFTDDMEIMRYINRREAYINHVSQIQFQLDEYKQAFKYDNLKCLIYTTNIETMRFIEDMCISRNLNPICLWSVHNDKYKMDRYQRDVRKYLLETGNLLDPYNVLIINRATETGVNIYDEDMQLVIVNTTNLTQQVQARGRVRHNVDLLVVRTNDKNKVNSLNIQSELLDKWLLKSNLENMIREYGLRDNDSRLMSVNKLIKYLSEHGYTIEKTRKRLDGKQNTLYKINKK